MQTNGGQKRLLISGRYGRGSSGDEIQLAGMLQSLRKLLPQLKVTVTSGDPAETETFHHVDSVPFWDRPQLFDAVRHSDLVLVCGNPFPHDGIPPDGCMAGRIPSPGWPLLAAAAAGVPGMLSDIWFGPLQADACRRLQRLAGLARAVTVCDRNSLEQLSSLGYSENDLPLVPDPVILFDAAQRRQSAGPHQWKQLPGPLAAVCPAFPGSQPASEQYVQDMAQALDTFIENSGGSVIFVPLIEDPLGRVNDRTTCAAVRERMVCRSGTHFAPGLSDPFYRFMLLQRSDLLLASRRHAVLAAISAGVPVVGVEGEQGVSGLYSRVVGGRSSASFPAPDGPSLANHLLRIWKNQSHMRQSMENWKQDAVAHGSLSARTAADLLQSSMQPEPDHAIAVELLEQEIMAAYATEAGSPGTGNQHMARETALQDVRCLIADMKRQFTTGNGIKRITTIQPAKGTSGGENPGRLQQELDHYRARALAAEEVIGNMERSRGFRLLNLLWRLVWIMRRPKSLVQKILQHAGHMFRSAGVVRRMFPQGSRGRQLLLGLRDKVQRQMEPDRQASAQLESALPDLESWAAQRSRSVFLIISPVPFNIDEGQRATNFTLELLQRGVAVLFVYWRWPGNAIGELNPLDGLLQLPLDIFLRNPGKILRRFPGLKKHLLLEYPHPDMFGPFATAQAAGWITVYDAIDDWDGFQRVGQAAWYDPQFEDYLLQHADLLLAVRHSLVQAIQQQCGRTAELVPNGLAPEISHVRIPRSLEHGEVTLGYFGYLSDAWFDWSLLLQAAERKPSWKIYLIGYGLPQEKLSLPENVIWLGRQPRSELAALAANWDAAVIPFKEGAVAGGADPIKTYEYLAMNLPVVAAGVMPPAGGEQYVTCVSGVEEFLQAVEQAALQGSVPGCRDFAAACSWAARLDVLFSAISDSFRVRQNVFLFGGGS